MQKLILFLVRTYRVVLSPLMGRHCRFEPSCSAYAETAVHYHGAARGSWLAFCRLCRCHPWHSGGYDPVPDAEPDR